MTESFSRELSASNPQFLWICTRYTDGQFVKSDMFRTHVQSSCPSIATASPSARHQHAQEQERQAARPELVYVRTEGSDLRSGRIMQSLDIAFNSTYGFFCCLNPDCGYVIGYAVTSWVNHVKNIHPGLLDTTQLSDQTGAHARMEEVTAKLEDEKLRLTRQPSAPSHWPSTTPTATRTSAGISTAGQLRVIPLKAWGSFRHSTALLKGVTCSVSRRGPSPATSTRTPLPCLPCGPHHPSPCP